MIFGEKSRFAIECEVEPTEGAVLAHFRLWAEGQTIGDFDDTIDLRSSINWLEDFLNYSGKRYEPSLENKNKNEVFQLVFDSVVLTVPKGVTLKEFLTHPVDDISEESESYQNSRERFHFDQVGMSSFSDKWNIILVEKRDGTARLIWRNLEDLELHESFLPPKYFEEVLAAYAKWGKSVLGKNGV